MKQRIITAVLAFFVLLPVLIFSDTFIFPLGLAVCAVLSVWEMFACVGLKNAWLFTAPMYVLGAAFPFLIRYLPDRDLLAPIAICAAVVWTLYAFTVLIFSHGKYPLEAVFVASFSLFYIFIGFNAILLSTIANRAENISTISVFSERGLPIFSHTSAGAHSASTSSFPMSAPKRPWRGASAERCSASSSW